jgi:Tfp pilus assembly protein PilP
LKKTYEHSPEILALVHPTKNEGDQLNNYRKQSHKRFWFTCEDCGEPREVYIFGVSAGKTRCNPCAAKLRRKKESKKKAELGHNIAALYPNLVAEIDFKHPRNSGLEPQKVLPKSRKIIWWICPVGHGSYPSHIFNRVRSHGCPKCKNSKLEEAVGQVLQKYGFEFNREYVLDLGKGSGNQRIDFLIEATSIGIVAIECQGIQHYEPQSFGCKSKTAKKMFEETQRRDDRKRKDLKRFNIPLIEIPCDEYREGIDLEEYVLEQFKLLGVSLNF